MAQLKKYTKGIVKRNSKKERGVLANIGDDRENISLDARLVI